MAHDLEILDSAPDEQSKIQTSSLLQIGWRHRSLIVLSTIVGIVLGTLYYLQSPPVYQSSASVLVVKKIADDIAGIESRSFLMEDYVSTHQILIKSHLIVSRAVQKSKLGELPSVAALDQVDQTEAIIGGLTVNRNKGPAGTNNVLDLSYRGKVAADCPKILQAVVESYKDFLDETYKSMSDDTLTLVKEARDKVSSDIAAREKEYADFKKSSPLIGRGKDGVIGRSEPLIDLQKKRALLTSRRVEIESQLEAIQVGLKEGKSREALLAVISDFWNRLDAMDGKIGPASGNSDKLFELILKRHELGEKLGDKHPDVEKIEKLISMAREFYSRPSLALMVAGGKAETAAKIDPLQAHIAYLKDSLAQIKHLDKNYADLIETEQAELKNLVVVEYQERTMENEIQRNQELYNSITKRLQNVSYVKSAGGYDAKQISPPGQAKKVSPNIMFIFPIAALLGVLAGSCLAYLAEVTDNSFRGPEDIRRQLGLPVIGHVPFFVSPTEEVASQDELNGIDPRLRAFLNPKSSEAEAYRGIRTSLYFSTRGEGHKLIQVTSPGMGDGKSTLASNLAVSIAQSGKQTLLIDADFRRPRQHKLFGRTNDVGFASVISHEIPLEEAIQETGIPGLSIMTSGPRPHNPAELLTSPYVKEIFEVLRERFDFVLVDTPPMLLVSDPSVVAPRVDGVLLTLRLSKHSRPTAERAKEILGTLNARILGVVVNGIGGDGSHSNYNYGSYGYGYSYGYGSKYNYSYTTYEDTEEVRVDSAAIQNGGHLPGANGTSSETEASTKRSSSASATKRGSQRRQRSSHAAGAGIGFRKWLPWNW